jgi:hypothetical protein
MAFLANLGSRTAEPFTREGCGHRTFGPSRPPVHARRLAR